MVSDLDHAYVFRAGSRPEDVHATFRLRGLSGTESAAEVIRVGPSGTRTVSSEALSTHGGGDVAIDPTDPKAQRTLHAQFVVVVRTDDAPPTMMPGQWARVRLGIAPEPLLVQAWRRTLQYFSMRRTS